MPIWYKKDTMKMSKSSPVYTKIMPRKIPRRWQADSDNIQRECQEYTKKMPRWYQEDSKETPRWDQKYQDDVKNIQRRCQDDIFKKIPRICHNYTKKTSSLSSE